MKFDMGAQTLATLGQATGSASQDLGTYVRRLADAATPLEGKFNGQGRAAFDSFKANVDEIANSLDAALSAVLAGVQGQDQAFGTGDQQAADATRQTVSATDFDAARFGSH
jgi:uncharacterized protein YukE